MAHCLRIDIAFGAQTIGLDLHGLAPLLEGGNVRDIEGKTAALKRGGYSRKVAAQQLRIEHGDLLKLLKTSL
jgi:hypothetical protein